MLIRKMEEWFNTFLKEHGFTLSPIILDPTSFSPYRVIRHPKKPGVSVLILVEVKNDIISNRDNHQEFVEYIVKVKTKEITEKFGDIMGPFNPNKNLKNFNFYE